ncbi:MAG: hypothetical protein U9R54_06560, partial [Bacteroidota bacterium]|nr:hypothetical protein [Bacteroidota bacterium]
NDIVNSEISDDEPKYTKQEYFLMTIKGDIVFDSLHPYYNDNEFKNDLLEHYIESEEYEKCEQIKSSN